MEWPSFGTDSRHTKGSSGSTSSRGSRRLKTCRKLYSRIKQSIHGANVLTLMSTRRAWNPGQKLRSKYMHRYAYIYIYVYMQMCVHTSRYVWIYAYMQICAHICVYIWFYAFRLPVFNFWLSALKTRLKFVIYYFPGLSTVPVLENKKVTF